MHTQNTEDIITGMVSYVLIPLIDDGLEEQSDDYTDWNPIWEIANSILDIHI